MCRLCTLQQNPQTDRVVNLFLFGLDSDLESLVVANQLRQTENQKSGSRWWCQIPPSAVLAVFVSTLAPVLTLRTMYAISCLDPPAVPRAPCDLRHRVRSFGPWAPLQYLIETF